MPVGRQLLGRDAHVKLPAAGGPRDLRRRHGAHRARLQARLSRMGDRVNHGPEERLFPRLGER